MRYGFLIVILGLLVASRSASALELLFAADGRPALQEDRLIDETGYDANGDGVPEICYFTPAHEPTTLHAVTVSGGTQWTYTLNLQDVCPSCSGPFSWYLLGFGELDPAAGREAVLYWDCQGIGNYFYGVTVVNLGTDAILANFVDATCEVLADLDGNPAHDEIILEFADEQGTARFEVWGAGSGLGADEPPIVANGGRRLDARVLDNPSVRGAAVAVTQGVSGPVRIDVYDVRGRHVRSIDAGTLEAGTHDVRWDGRDERGAEAERGTYFLAVRVGPEVVTRKAVRLR